MELVSSHLAQENFGFFQILSNSFRTTQKPRYLGIGSTLVAALLAVYQEICEFFQVHADQCAVGIIEKGASI